MFKYNNNSIANIGDIVTGITEDSNFKVTGKIIAMKPLDEEPEYTEICVAYIGPETINILPPNFSFDDTSQIVTLEVCFGFGLLHKFERVY